MCRARFAAITSVSSATCGAHPTESCACVRPTAWQICKPGRDFRSVSAISFLDGWVHVSRFKNVIRRTKAQIVDVIGDVAPSMRHAGGDDDDVARLHRPPDDVDADDRA